MVKQSRIVPHESPLAKTVVGLVKTALECSQEIKIRVPLNSSLTRMPLNFYSCARVTQKIYLYPEKSTKSS